MIANSMHSVVCVKQANTVILLLYKSKFIVFHVFCCSCSIYVQKIHSESRRGSVEIESTAAIFHQHSKRRSQMKLRSRYFPRLLSNWLLAFLYFMLEVRFTNYFTFTIRKKHVVPRPDIN